MDRIDAAVALANEKAPDVVKADAAEFVSGALRQPQDTGVTRVLFHSIVWQYVPVEQQQTVEAEMAQAAAAATHDKPLAWLMLETNRETFKHELTVRYWDGSDACGAPHMLACAHPHGAWVEWLAD